MQALSFEGKGFEYFKIWIVNILLTIITLGLYYPWAKVRNRRYFYANSTLEGKNFEYHATGKQLFIGYLIGLVLLIAYVALQNTLPVVSSGMIILFFIALPWIIWRSLKFNMRVTSFSNVLFSFDGKLGGAYFNYMLLPIIFFLFLYIGPLAIAVFSGLSGMLITIGVLVSLAVAIYLFALMKKRNTSYVANGTNYGQGQFAANLEVAPFVKIALKSIGLFIFAMIAYMVLTALFGYALGISDSLLGLAGDMNNPEAMQDIFQNSSVVLLVALIYLGFIVVSIAVFSYSYTRQRAYIYNNVKLDEKITFSSTLSARGFTWVSVSNLIMVVLTLGLAIPWASVRMARLVLDNTHVDTSLGIDNYVTQQQKAQSALGEQIGDAFDVDVGIGF